MAQCHPRTAWHSGWLGWLLTRASHRPSQCSAACPASCLKSADPTVRVFCTLLLASVFVAEGGHGNRRRGRCVAEAQGLGPGPGARTRLPPGLARQRPRACQAQISASCRRGAAAQPIEIESPKQQGLLQRRFYDVQTDICLQIASIRTCRAFLSGPRAWGRDPVSCPGRAPCAQGRRLTGCETACPG